MWHIHTVMADGGPIGSGAEPLTTAMQILIPKSKCWVTDRGSFIGEIQNTLDVLTPKPNPNDSSL